MVEPTKYDRRKFIKDSSFVASGFLAGGFILGHKVPKVTFCGAAQQVSGSCYLLETHYADFLIDCGSFFSENELSESDQNSEFPYFDPKKIKGVFVTHAHTDHIGKLPLLYAKGFRGSIYCTDCTRDLAAAMYSIVGGSDTKECDTDAISSEVASELLSLFVPVSYGEVREEGQLTFRFSEAGHILGSAMVEIWVSGRKFLFTGDMGPDYAPLTRLPQQHEQADFVLVESTYGVSPRQVVDFKNLGRKIANVIERGGDVLFPAFVLHKTQSLIYVIHQLKGEGIIPKNIPVICDSSSAHRINHVYNTYSNYYRKNVYFNNANFNRSGLIEITTFNSFNFKKEYRDPVIYISASGNLSHANSPMHLAQMAGDKRNAVILVGWQSPNSIGGRLLKLKGKDKFLLLPKFNSNDQNKKEVPVEIQLEVSKWGPGFSSHASGEQILDWISGFKKIGTVCVVHGEKTHAIDMAKKIKQMGVNSIAPVIGQVVKAYQGGVNPGKPPVFDDLSTPSFAPTDT